MVVLTFKLCAKYMNKNVALLISLALLTSADLLFYGTVNSGEIDLFYSLIAFSQVVCIFHFYEKKSWLKLFVFSYTLLALGFLTKGPPSLAFQLFTLLVWFGYNRNLKSLFSLQHITGIFLSILICTAYFVTYHNQLNSLDLIGRLFTEANQKTGAESSILQILQNAALFPLRLIKILLPWSVLLFLFRWKKFKKAILENRVVAFSAMFILANIWLYWFTGDSKDRYLYMFVPFFIILISTFFKNAKWIFYTALILLVIRIIFNYTYLPILDKSKVAEYREVSQEILDKTKGKDVFLYGNSQHIDSKIFGPFNFYQNRLKTAPLFAYQAFLLTPTS